MPAWSADLCVAPGVNLKALVDNAALSPGDLTLRLQTGTHNYNGALVIAAANRQLFGRLSIRGGYDAACQQRSATAANTVLNLQADGTGTSLRLDRFDAVEFDGLRVLGANGAATIDVGEMSAGLPYAPGVVLRQTQFENFAKVGGGAFLIRLREARGALVENNLFAQIVGGAAAGSDSTTPACALALVGTTSRNTSSEGVEYQGVEWTHNTFGAGRGGTLAAPSNGCMEWHSAAGVYSEYQAHNNIWFNSGAQPLNWVISHAGTAPRLSAHNNVLQAIAFEADVDQETGGNLQADPLYVNPGSDWRLQLASPAVDTGSPLVRQTPNGRDLRNGIRVLGPGPDRGAYELGGPLIIFTVTSPADSGAGSLRQAVMNANSQAGVHRIQFNIAGSCPQVINLATALPDIVDSLEVDGYSQPGSAANSDPEGSNATLCVLVQGSGIPSSVSHAFRLASASASLRIRGLALRNFSDAAITAVAGSGLRVSGNQFGGTLPGIVGSFGNGIGVEVDNFATHALIGGGDPADRNLILASSGAQGYGVAIRDASDFCSVRNNLIGIRGDLDGVLGNRVGVMLDSINPCEVRDNLIAGNGEDGILLQGADARVFGNRIGAAALSAPTLLGQGGDGIALDAGASQSRIGAALPTQAASGALANQVRYSGGSGVHVRAAAGQGNVVRGNLLEDNALSEASALALDLAAVGPLANDAGDGDSGPNGLQNYPLVVDAVAQAGGPAGSQRYLVSGSLQGANALHMIDIYAADRCGAQRGEAGAHLGSIIAPVIAGSANFARTVDVPPGMNRLALTATDPAGSTSEIGPCFALERVFANGFE